MEQKQKKFKRTELKAMLTEGECIVEFTKVGGEKRIMPCTLNPELMPAPPEVKEGTEKKTKKEENPTVINAWCTDAKGWRSFRVANVTDIKFKD